MNIFYLDNNPEICAEYHCDKHVVKMILECAQLLSTAHRVLDNSEDERLYKATHVNHPCSIWVRECDANYFWTYILLTYLCDEYTLRYNKIHKCETILEILENIPKNIPKGKITKRPICMPDEYKVDEDPIICYRAYYNGDKAKFAKWKLGNIPEWFNGDKENAS